MLKNVYFLVYKIDFQSFIFIMSKGKNIDLVSLLQDETFLNLVKGTEGIENQLDVLEKKYPGQREAIAYAVQFVRINLSDKKRMSSKDVAMVWKEIRKYTDHSKIVAFHRFTFHEIWKVAAVFIVVFASAILTYQHFTIDPLVKIAGIKTGVSDEAMIILSDGSKHILGVNNTQIEYSLNGGAVVVKKDKEEERIENSNASKEETINQIIVPYGHRHEITLSDGTHIYLNSGSRLVFPAKFSGSKREVCLLGEGYFEVSKNPDKPFIVKTNFVDIKVLGTVFNISAYEDEQIATTVLVEGKVTVSQKNKMFGYSEKKLEPGEGCFYSLETQTSEIRNVNLCEYVSWIDGIIPFKDKPLIGIVNRVERYYNKKILIEGDKLANTLISGKLVLTDEIEEVVHRLAKTVEGGYEKNENGSYSIKNARN